MNLGLIGCGHWGKNIARNLHDLGYLQSVCDLSESKRKRAERNYQIETFSKYGKLLDSPGLDGVVVATPAVTHHSIAKAALERGLHVFVEKPIAVSVADCEELVAQADEKGLVLMAGHIYCYNPAIQKIEELLVELNGVYLVYSQRLAFFQPRSDVGVLWDLVVHDVSILQHLLGRPSRARMQSRDYFGNGLEDFASVELLFDGGMTAHIDASWFYPHKIRQMVFTGKKRILVWDDMARDYCLELHEKWVDSNVLAHFSGNTLTSVSDAEPLRLELQHFVHCIETGETPLTDGKVGLEATRILAAAEKSNGHGGWEQIEYC